MNDDINKQLIELAVASGRKKLSSQTGFIHHHYHALEEETHYPIPVLENILFALALMRTKTMENMTEGKLILERLLSFQNADGHFPIYLHEFPEGKDRFLGVQLLIPLYWITKNFHMVLGQELKKRVDGVIKRLLDYCLRTYAEIKPPAHIAIKLGAVANVLGRQEGEQILDTCKSDQSGWGNPYFLGEWLSALQLIQPTLPNSSWNSLWKQVNATWHRGSASFTGPAWKENQQGFEQQITLYDLYMGLYSGSFSDRALKDTLVHLHGAIIQSTEDRLETLDYPYQYASDLGTIHQVEKRAFSIIEQNEKPAPHLQKFHHPLKIVWGTQQRSHSFVMQGGNIAQIKTTVDAEKIEFLLTLGELVNMEDREESREVSFFFDISLGTTILINERASNTFKLNDKITVSYGDMKFSLFMELVKGEGHFFGHLMRGNRPSQCLLKGSNRFNAYDWTLFLRTVRRTKDCQLKVTLEWLEG